MLEYRQLLSLDCYTLRNQVLCQKVLKRIQEEKIKVIHSFLPIAKNREPDLSSIFSELRMSGSKIMVSKTDFQKRTLTHYFLEEDTMLAKNRLGIPEPEGAEPANPDDIDLILVPLAAADKINQRIGYGGGFYDRLLADSQAVKIGICLSPLLDEIAQMEEWDVRLDAVLTPFD